MKIKLTMRLFRNYPLSKRVCIIAVVAASAISIIGFCAIVFSGSHIEDTNGPQNTKLAVLTMDDILSDGHSSTTFASSSTCSGSNTNVSGKLREYDYDKITFRAKKTSGIQVLHATKINSARMTLHINARVETGNLEVIILVDGVYHSHVTIGSKQAIQLDGIGGKTVVVKMAAESAEVSISITRTIH